MIKKKQGEVFQIVEEMPSFPEGNQKLNVFLKESFIVETDGSLSDFKIVKSLRDKYDEEALRVLKAMPRWNPGKQRGRPVRVSYTLRISFTSNNQ